MTARPLDPENRRRPLLAAVALVLVMVVVLLATGCEDVIHNHAQDLVIVKLNHDGSTAWIKTIATGKNYNIYDALQTSEGGYALAGLVSTPLCNPQCKGYENTTPVIIRLSNNGEITSELGFPSEMKDKSGHLYPILGLVQTPDNGFYAISETGTILSVSQSGTSRGSRFVDTNPLNKTHIASIIRTRDGGSIISGFTVPCESLPNGNTLCPTLSTEFIGFVEKLDQAGNTTWSRFYPLNEFSQVNRIIELNDDNGYAGVMSRNRTSILVLLDKNGMIVNSSPISVGALRYNLLPGTDGFSVLIHPVFNNTYPLYNYDNHGTMTNTVMINFSNEPDAVIALSDPGYLSVNIFSVRKMNGNGEQIWDRPIASLLSPASYSHINKLIETSDNGYLIVLGIEKKGSLYK